MTEELRASVVVPVRDGAATIGRALAGLRGQSLAAEFFEVLVVDNGSRDATADIVRGAGFQLLHASTPGASAARNVGLAAARAPIVAYLDADIVPTRRWLAAILAAFDDPGVGLAGGRTLSMTPTTPAQHYVAQCGRFEPENNIRRDTFPFAPSQNLAVRREIARAAGGWAEDLHGAEDVDLCHRCLRAAPASRLVYVADAIALHHERQDALALRRQAALYGRGAAEMYLRYPEVARWNASRTWQVVGLLLARSAAAIGWTLRPAGNRSMRYRRDFARYHSLWAWAWWGAFFRRYLAGQHR